MAEQELLAERFEANRPRLRAVAYRMLGSPAEADDAVQEAWLRLTRADASGVDNLAGWLTTVVARVCLDMLRALVNGAAGAVWAPGGKPRIVFSFTITRGQIVGIELLADPERLGQLDLTVLD